MRHTESKIQQTCVRWFRLQYPHLQRLLFHPKNEGHGSRVAGAIAKAEGVVAGVPDLILAVPNSSHHMLCVEMKTPTGRQSASQKEFQQVVEAAGAQYVIVRDLLSFVKVVSEYLETADNAISNIIKNEKQETTKRLLETLSQGVHTGRKSPRPKRIQAGSGVGKGGNRPLRKSEQPGGELNQE